MGFSRSSEYQSNRRRVQAPHDGGLVPSMEERTSQGPVASPPVTLVVKVQTLSS
jgi:hypothetical protein